MTTRFLFCCDIHNASCKIFFELGEVNMFTYSLNLSSCVSEPAVEMLLRAWATQAWSTYFGSVAFGKLLSLKGSLLGQKVIFGQLPKTSIGNSSDCCCCCFVLSFSLDPCSLIIILQYIMSTSKSCIRQSARKTRHRKQRQRELMLQIAAISPPCLDRIAFNLFRSIDIVLFTG